MPTATSESPAKLTCQTASFTSDRARASKRPAASGQAAARMMKKLQADRTLARRNGFHTATAEYPSHPSAGVVRCGRIVRPRFCAAYPHSPHRVKTPRLTLRHEAAYNMG